MKKTVALIIAIISAFSLAACGEKPISQTGKNIVENSVNSGRKYDVQIDERTEDTKYEYGEDDLSLVDTDSGNKITLGMTEADIETIAGAPEQIDRDYRIYDGLVVKYSNGTAVSFIVASGQFKDGKETRYKTTRGVGIGTSAEDFKKAYGDSYIQGEDEVAADGEAEKTASKAVRYFEKDGKKLNFLGTELTHEQSSKNNKDRENYYQQDFMFGNSNGNIATIRISLLSAI